MANNKTNNYGVAPNPYLSKDYKTPKSNGSALMRKRIIDEQRGAISTKHKGVPEELNKILKRNLFSFTLRKVEKALVSEGRVFLSIIPAGRTKIYTAHVIDYRLDGAVLEMIQYRTGSISINGTKNTYDISVKEELINDKLLISYIVYSNATKRVITNKYFNTIQEKLKLPEEMQIINQNFLRGEMIPNNIDWESDISYVEFLSGLLEKVLADIPDDIDITSPKVIWRKKLSNKASQQELEFTMRNGRFMIFKDNNAIYNSPLDLWNPQSKADLLMKLVDFLLAKGSLFTNGFKETDVNATNMHSPEVVTRNISAQNYIEEKIEIRSIFYESFYKKLLAITTNRTNIDSIEDLDIEVLPSKTVDRLINAEKYEVKQDKPNNNGGE